MGITWSKNIYKDSTDVQYKLGYEATISNTATETKVTIDIWLSTRYYFWDTENKTRVHWGTAAATPNSKWENWAIATDGTDNDIKCGSSSEEWANPFKIGKATKTYIKASQSGNYVFTATLDGVTFKSWPVVTYSFNVPAPALTVNLHSNYATYGKYKGDLIDGINESSNIPVLTQTFYKGETYLNGISDIQNPAHLYLEKTDCRSTGNWGTKEKGGILINQTTSFTGAELATMLGLNISAADAEINLYAQWEPIYIKIYANYKGEKRIGTLYARNSTGELKPVKELYQNIEDNFIQIK